MTEYWIRDNNYSWVDNWQTQGDYTETGMKRMVKKHLIATNCDYGDYFVEVMQGTKGQLDEVPYDYMIGYLVIEYSKNGITIVNNHLDVKELNAHDYRKDLRR